MPSPATTIMTDLNGVPSIGVFNTPTYQTTSLDTTNPKYPRLVQLTDVGVILQSTGTTVGIFNEDIMQMIVAHFPQMTWPPVISVQPSSGSVHHPISGTFALTASAETPINYLWQISTNGGASFSSLSDGGYYLHTASPTLVVENTDTSLNGDMFRCAVWNTSGTTLSQQVTFTVT